MRVMTLIVRASSVLALTIPLAAQTVRPAEQLNTNGDNSASSNFQECYSLAAQGNMFVAVWPEHEGFAVDLKDAYFTRSLDDGLTWSTPTRIDTGDAAHLTDTEEPHVVITNSGNIVAIFEDAKNAIPMGAIWEDCFYNVSTDGGVTWLPSSLPLNVATSSDVNSDIDDPQLTVEEGTDNVYVVWEEDTLSGLGGDEEMWFTGSTDGGLSWSTPIVLPTNPSSSGGIIADVDYPNIAAAGGSIVVAFVDNTNGDDDVFVKTSLNGGSTWVQTQLDTVATGDVNYTLIAGSGSNFCVIWDDLDPTLVSVTSVHASVSTDGGVTWSPEFAISGNVETTPGSESIWASLDVRGDNIYVAYADDSESVAAGGATGQAGSKAYVAYSHDAGANWIRDVALDPVDPRRNHRPVIRASDARVVVHVETGVNGANHAALTVSSDFGATWADLQEVPNPGADCDLQGRTEGNPLAVSNVSHVGVSAYWDNYIGNNELYVTGIEPPAEPGVGYCFGDPSSGIPCPCANDNDGTVPGSGCANGVFFSGAKLIGTGLASVSNDTLVLSCSGLEPSNTGLYFQANNAVNGGDGNLFGDGLRCAGGGLIRLQIRFADGSGASATTLAIGTKGLVTAGDMKRYQCWYRTTNNPPCGLGVNDFNLSNGYEIAWTP